MATAKSNTPIDVSLFEKHDYLVYSIDDVKELVETLKKGELLRFGYCPRCKGVTAYSGNYGMEGCFETCRKCNETFGGWGMGATAPGEYLTGENIPKKYQEEAKTPASKEFQLAIAKWALTRMAKKDKEECRQIQRGLAKTEKLLKEVK